jgi:isoquinoline 1-oxidoreductase subunit alpha
MISLNVNGLSVEANATPDTPLLWVLRDHLGLAGDGRNRASVHESDRQDAGTDLPSVEMDGTDPALGDAASELGARPSGRLKPVRRCRRRGSTSRSCCGYCQSGQIMAAAALLAKNPHPDDAAIDG